MQKIGGVQSVLDFLPLQGAIQVPVPVLVLPLFQVQSHLFHHRQWIHHLPVPRRRCPE
uniref:hypothetical protein n=1 Tax=Photorhabdus sp. RM322S TaxID=3342825 RepID=UPI0036D9F699